MRTTDNGGSQRSGGAGAARFAPLVAIGVFLAAWSPSAVVAESVSMAVDVNRQDLYVGESAIMTVVVKGLDDPGSPPDLSAIKHFDVAFQGSRSASQRSITIVNGRMTQRNSIERHFVYSLTARDAGTFTTGPILFRHGGKEIRDPGVTMRVSGIEEQDVVLIEVNASKPSVLVDEPFDITLRIAIKQLPKPYADNEPIDPGYPPALSIPYITDSPPDGLEPPNLGAILGRLEARSGNVAGFSINGIASRGTSLFDFFDERRPARYALEKRVVQQNGKPYVEYTLKLAYRATQEGVYTFGPVVMKGTVIAGVDSRRKAIGKRIFAVGPAATVQVVPPPEENRPASFVGALGTNLTADAALDTQSCQVGDPLTLTLTVAGPFRKDSLRPPPLSEQPAVTQNFRVYDDSVETRRNDDTVQFVYTIRPTTAGSLELPPIDVSYYNTRDSAYRTVRTRPIPVWAKEGARVESTIIIGGDTNAVDNGVSPASGDAFVLAPLNMDTTGAVSTPLLRTYALARLAAVGPLVFCLVCLARVGRRHSGVLRGVLRKRSVLHAVTDALAEARRCAATDAGRARQLTSSAIRKFLAWRYGAGKSGLTPMDAAALLRRADVSVTAADELVAVLERSFNAEYGGGSSPDAPDAAADAATALRLVHELHAGRRRDCGPEGRR